MIRRLAVDPGHALLRSQFPLVWRFRLAAKSRKRGAGQLTSSPVPLLNAALPCSGSAVGVRRLRLRWEGPIARSLPGGLRGMNIYKGGRI